MKEVNPRSQLRSMKLRYFLAVTGLTTGIFILLYLIAQILFMIFELQPYVRLAIAVFLFIADAMIVNRLVNYHWIERWTREEAVDRGGLEAPEPEYVMDDEMVRKLTLKQKLKKPLFSWKKKEEENPLEAVVSSAAVKAEVPAAAKEQAEPLSEGDWKTPFEEQKTMRISGDELNAVKEEDLTAEEIAMAVSASLAKKEDLPEEPVMKHGKKRTEKPAETSLPVPVSTEIKSEAVSSWRVPFDEMPTGDLSSVYETRSEPASEDAAVKKAASQDKVPEGKVPEVKEAAKSRRGRPLFRKAAEETVSEVKPERSRRTKEKAAGKSKESAPQPAAEETPAKVSSWRVPFDEMPTGDISSVYEKRSEPTVEKAAVKKEKPPKEEVQEAEKRRGFRHLFRRPKEETVLEVKSDGGRRATEKTSSRKTRENAQKRTAEEKSAGASSWKVPFDEMPTADLSAVLDPANEATAGISARITEETPEEAPGKERKLRKLFQRPTEETVIEVYENKNASVVRKKKERPAERRPEKKTGRKTEKRAEVKQEKKQRQNSEGRRKSERSDRKRKKTTEAVKETARSSWSVPFDEMPTEELSKVVENGKYEGYNPYNSDEGNK